MSNIKVIKINKSLKNKKTLYKDILSSSETIKNIIKNKKHLSNNSLIKDTNKYDTNNSSIGYNNSNSNLIKDTNKYDINNSSIGYNNSNSNLIKDTNKYDTNNSSNNIKKKNLSKKTNIEFFVPKSHNKYRSNNIKKYFQKKHIEIKIFTKEEIIRYIKVLNKFSYKDQYKIIHKYIRKLNKFQTIQILYALKLIKNKSNAPNNLLKNLLYSYFTCYLTIIKN